MQTLGQVDKSNQHVMTKDELGRSELDVEPRKSRKSVGLGALPPFLVMRGK